MMSASLLGLEDLLKQHPDAREVILASDIARRESELVLLRSHRSLLGIQLWSALQTAIVAGLVIFSFGVALSGFVEVANVMQRVQSWNASLTGSVFTRGLQTEIQNIIPTSTVLQVAHYIPFWDIQDATLLSVIVALGILTLRVIQTLTSWKASRSLKRTIHTLESELSMVREWSSSRTQEQKKSRGQIDAKHPF